MQVTTVYKCKGCGWITQTEGVSCDCQVPALMDFESGVALFGGVARTIGMIEEQIASSEKIMQALGDLIRTADAASLKGPSSALPRCPNGRINNCSLYNCAAEEDCQMCGGSCPEPPPKVCYGSSNSSQP